METIRKYPLDVSGRNPNNLVLNEPHELVGATANDYRVLIPNYGGYYTDSLKIRDENGTLLEPKVDFVATYLYQDATELTALEVCGAVVVTNPNISARVYIDYQVVGGNYAMSVDALTQVLETLDAENQVVEWGGIVGIPTTFPVGGHLHALWELYGFEYLVAQLERVNQAILVGNTATLDELRNYAYKLYEDGKGYTDELDDRFRNHVSDTSNPHQVTKAQVGLGSVQNYPMATNTEIEVGTAENRYIHVAGVIHAIDHHLGRDFRNHTTNYSNPHQVTKAQVGLGSVQDYPIATLSEARAGTSNTRYMTPLNTREAIESQIGSAFDDHKNDTTNPHQVTKAQVGLGSVLNYDISSLSEAQAGTVNNKYMTPLRTSQAIETLLGNAFNAHRSDTSNPHNVTKAQVGLGSVQNYPIATTSEAQVGTATDKYMTPSLTKEAITSQVGNAFNAHVNDRSNPHNVTKVQVGLGSVLNYGIASTSEAQVGSSNNKYMTPLRTKEAIAFQIGSSFDSHLSDRSNPHNVTKAQVGLGSVLNYGIATVNEAREGTVNNKYMTPLRTNQAISVQAGDLIREHAGLTNNPHNVTKAQVGLGSVLNYGIATQAQAQEGTVNTAFMTPLRARQAFGPSFQEHVTNGFNMPRTGPTSRIHFGSWDTDPGWIEHHVVDDVGRMRFCVSDNVHDQDDNFQWGGFDANGFGSFADLDRHRLWVRGDIRGLSDGRVKKNFRGWDNPLELLSKMRGGLYERIDLNDTTQVGVIAQEMLEILPEVVGYDKDNDAYSVAYGNLTAFLIETCKALLNRVEALEGAN